MKCFEGVTPFQRRTQRIAAHFLCAAMPVACRYYSSYRNALLLQVGVLDTRSDSWELRGAHQYGGAGG